MILYLILGCVGILIFMALIALVVVRKNKQLGTVSPVGEKMLRPAGYSLRLRLVEIEESLGLYLVQSFCVPIILGFMPIALFQEVYSSESWVAITGLPFAMMVIIAGWIIGFHLCLKKFRLSANCELGLRGEELVGQKLNPLYQKGYRIFHDFPVFGRKKISNIDHIVLGPNGIFVIETKMRRKHTKLKTAQESHKVEYNGEELIYPHYKDRDGVGQTEANVKYLKEFLWMRTGKRLPVTGILTRTVSKLRLSKHGIYLS